MSELDLFALKFLFLFGFTLHNMEEAIWLPKWSQHAKKFHEPVETNEFLFAVIIVTILGYLLSAVDFLIGSPGNFSNYLYLGFIGMMGINVIFPHLLGTIILKKYAPGLITGLLLNLPFSFIIIRWHIKNGTKVFYLFVAIAIVAVLMLFSLKYLFRLGKKLFNYSN